jgi:predicted nuclease with TOPRIM domain
MDLRTAAPIKANSRLKPAKDISVACSKLISNTNAEKFRELQEKLVLAIDPADAECQILQSEISAMNDLLQEWEREMELCRDEVLELQTEMLTLGEEREAIEGRRKRLSQLQAMKERLISANIPDLVSATFGLARANYDAEKEIESIEATNEKRRIGLDASSPVSRSSFSRRSRREASVNLTSEKTLIEFVGCHSGGCDRSSVGDV